METPKINITTDYNLFKFYEQNRPVGSNKTIVKSIKEINLTPYNPIIVNSDFYIIDGQNRFEACRKLDLPIYFVILPKQYDTDLAMITLNKHQDMWRQEDFLHFHATEQGGCWKDLEEFDKAHKLGISNSVVIYPLKFINASQLKMGTVKFEKNTLAESIVEFLNDERVKELKFRKTRPFVLAVRKAFETYEPKQIAKLKKKILLVEMSANYEQYLTAFKNILRK